MSKKKQILTEDAFNANGNSTVDVNTIDDNTKDSDTMTDKDVIVEESHEIVDNEKEEIKNVEIDNDEKNIEKEEIIDTPIKEEIKGIKKKNDKKDVIKTVKTIYHNDELYYYGGLK